MLEVRHIIVLNTNKKTRPGYLCFHFKSVTICKCEFREFIKSLTKSTNSPTFMPRRKSDVDKIVLNNSKATKELKWLPQVNIEDGIARTVDYLKNN